MLSLWIEPMILLLLVPRSTIWATGKLPIISEEDRAEPVQARLAMVCFLLSHTFRYAVICKCYCLLASNIRFYLIKALIHQNTWLRCSIFVTVRSVCQQVLLATMATACASVFNASHSYVKNICLSIHITCRIEHSSLMELMSWWSEWERERDAEQARRGTGLRTAALEHWFWILWIH